MHAEIVLATHVAMHHKLHRKLSGLTRLEDHRTDGWRGGSAPLFDFNVRGLTKVERPASGISDGKGGRDRLPKFNIA